MKTKAKSMFVPDAYREFKETANEGNIDEDALHEYFVNHLQEMVETSKSPVFDIYGKRYAKCEICGKIGSCEEFAIYGGRGHINTGLCTECAHNKSVMDAHIEQTRKEHNNFREERGII